MIVPSSELSSRSLRKKPRVPSRCKPIVQSREGAALKLHLPLSSNRNRDRHQDQREDREIWPYGIQGVTGDASGCRDMDLNLCAESQSVFTLIDRRRNLQEHCAPFWKPLKTSVGNISHRMESWETFSGQLRYSSKSPTLQPIRPHIIREAGSENLRTFIYKNIQRTIT